MNVMKVMNNKTFAHIATSTASSIAIATLLKSVGRPTFIYLDKNTKPETKKYSASKEFFYQLLCLGIYLSIIPLFKKGGYELAKKVFKGNTDVEKLFEEYKDPTIVTIKKGKKEVKKALNGGFEHFYYALHKAEDEGDVKLPMKKINGGVVAISNLGSVLGLAILAPQLSHLFLHPIMKAVGLDKKHDEHKEHEQHKLNVVSK